jgi:hypothetical protein
MNLRNILFGQTLRYASQRRRWTLRVGAKPKAKTQTPEPLNLEPMNPEPMNGFPY